MRGGLFLYPLHVDPADAAAADTREALHSVTAEPAATTEPVDPQRLATLIRSTDRLGSASEATEINADVLNSLPKWAQAVVQTGCFHGKYIICRHVLFSNIYNCVVLAGRRMSSRNKLKRNSGQQSELDYGQARKRPRRRRSSSNNLNCDISMEDEASELQEGLDELNMLPDADSDTEEIEIDDIPTFSTKAEITADSVEKYAELLEKLIDVSNERQQLESFERDGMNVFQAKEVKILRQSVNAIEKNDWMNKLEPELLISMMSSFDAQDVVQRITTLVVSIIQSCAARKFMMESDPGSLKDSVESSTPDTVTEEKSSQNNDAVLSTLDNTRNCAKSFVRMLLRACWKKTEDRDNRLVLDNFVEDLLVMFVCPEWIGAEELLVVLSSSLASILHANISADVKNPDSHHSLAALTLTGQICTAIKRYQKKDDLNAVDYDSNDIEVIEEHIGCLREVFTGKRTGKRKRSRVSQPSSSILHQIGLKHIVVMHLQRYNDHQSDSRTLILLKFISESKDQWGDDEANYMEQEKKLWESQWGMPVGSINSLFKATTPSSTLAVKSSLHLAVKREFCSLFDRLLAHVMALLSKGMPSLRARVMKCLRGIVDVDPMLMAEDSMQVAVERCCSDEKPSVREAAVDLIGTYVLLNPSLFDKYFDVLAGRLRDKGIKVRKSVCKIFKTALISMQERSDDAITVEELRRKSACMRCLVERVGHAAEDQGIKNFIIDTFQEVWFGSELSTRLSHPLSDFGDGNTLPPGWSVVTTVDENPAPTSLSVRGAQFVSDDGNIANSVEEAWCSYRTPMVEPASLVKTNHSKIDNSLEVVTTIVEVIHGMPNLGWFAELLKRLLAERNTTSKKQKTVMPSTKYRLDQVAIAENRSEKIIDRLVECLIGLQEGALLNGVSIGDAHQQFLSCMTALSVFCKAKPQLLAHHLETICVYLKEEDVKVQSLSVTMINNILNVKRAPQSVAGRLEKDLELLVLRSPPSVVGPSIQAKLQCLISMKELLQFEEQRLGNGLATRTMNRSKSKEQQVQGDQEADASLIGNVMQAELEDMLLLSLHKVPQIRKEAVACISALITQGLVNPSQCIPNLVALETDRIPEVRDAAFSQLLELYERFRNEFRTPSIKGIQNSYAFQLSVYNNATSLGIDENKKEFCLFGRLYRKFLTWTKSHESPFLNALVKQFTDQGSVLKLRKGKLVTANSKVFTSGLKYLCYLAQIISTLPYIVEDEPLYIIYSINRYVSLRLGPVLDDLRAIFAEAGIAPELLKDDESDLTTLSIDKYQPFSQLDGKKLVALQVYASIAFAIGLMLRLKFALKRNYQLDNDKCATYKPSTPDVALEAKERCPKKLLLPSVDDLCQTDDPIKLNWNLFIVAWYAAREDQKQLDVELEEAETPKPAPKRRRRSRRAVLKKKASEDDSVDEDADIEGFA
ncbi:Nipped-B [Phytophthora megakarya]|uniref:Sister chromatid cohesion protein n=1 Tax=Phytophthora megakarya TaxID=4795 RepID=A0A225X4A8_9STRA|nr:Nipped-B [Phytophthora megakarya]